MAVKVNQAMLDQPKVSAVTPSNDHGETDDRPRPTPRITRINESAAAAMAPARIAPHDTALSRGSSTTGGGVTTATVAAATGSGWA